MSYTRDMYMRTNLMDERSRQVRMYALQKGEQGFLKRYTWEKIVQPELHSQQVMQKLAAEELLLTHPEYLDEEGHYYVWFAHWYHAGYECLEDAKTQQAKEYISWY